MKLRQLKACLGEAARKLMLIDVHLGSRWPSQTQHSVYEKDNDHTKII